MSRSKKHYRGDHAWIDVINNHEKHLSPTQQSEIKKLMNVKGVVIDLIPGPDTSYILEITVGYVKTTVEPDFDLEIHYDVKNLVDVELTKYLNSELAQIPASLAVNLTKYFEGKLRDRRELEG